MLNISAEHKKEHLYLEVYHYYRKLILEGRLLPGSKMPSLRKCAQELKLSRTTIENAYLLLAADGYIIARAQSGYYVTGIASKQHLLTPKNRIRISRPAFMILPLPVLTGKASVLICGSVTSKAPSARATVCFLMANPRAKAISGRFSQTISGNAEM
ncbi:MAG: GntR family transcriptional regulator [Blautia massiliensis (ex Durand et al. 2017)]